MSILDNPTAPILDMLSPRCPECGEIVLPAVDDLTSALTASFASSLQRMLAGAPFGQVGHHGRRHHHRHHDHHYGHGPGCGCPECRHDHDHHYGHGPGCGCPECRHDQDIDHHYGHGPGCGSHKRSKKRRHRHDCWACGHDCRSCGADPCECQCCIPKSDLLVYARVGETRVVPITIENHRPRERHVTLHLSGWTTIGSGTGTVDTVSLGPTQFELEPCKRRAVVLKVRTLGQAGGDDDDVESCSVAYADLTLEGCDRKPIRIAVAMLPRECGPYEIDCWCGCC
jgi:hypothetical protein